MAQKPPYIHHDACFGIVAPSGCIQREAIDRCRSLLLSLGYRCKIGEHVYDVDGVFAGKDLDRQRDFQNMIDDPEVQVVLCARGGYGAVRTMTGVNWDRFKEQPKWIVGYSDVTYIHQVLQVEQQYSIHGVMCSGFFENEGLSPSASILLEMLNGKPTVQKIDSHHFNRCGDVEAPIVGGNLSMIYSAMGTDYDINTDGKILFIEDLCEYTYHLDRMMMSMKIAGKLNKLAALVVGQMSDFKEGSTPFGKSQYEVIADVVSDYDFPVCYNFPIGHVGLNIPVKIGMQARLDVAEDGVQYQQI